MGENVLIFLICLRSKMGVCRLWYRCQLLLIPYICFTSWIDCSVLRVLCSRDSLILKTSGNQSLTFRPSIKCANASPLATQRLIPMPLKPAAIHSPLPSRHVIDGGRCPTSGLPSEVKPMMPVHELINLLFTEDSWPRKEESLAWRYWTPDSGIFASSPVMACMGSYLPPPKK